MGASGRGANFFFWAAPADLALVYSAIFETGVRGVGLNVERGKLVRLQSWNEKLARYLEAFDYFYLAGDFTVDLRVIGKSFVSDNSGPVLGLRRPSMRANKRIVLKFVRPGTKRPEGELKFYSGLVRVKSRYLDFSQPRGSKRDYEAEARVAHKQIVKALKRVLVKHDGRWVGPTARQWALTGPATFS